jgi:hypothetical protein
MEDNKNAVILKELIKLNASVAKLTQDAAVLEELIELRFKVAGTAKNREKDFCLNQFEFILSIFFLGVAISIIFFS